MVWASDAVPAASQFAMMQLIASWGVPVSPLLVHCASSNRVGALRALTASAHGEALESAITTGKTWGLTGLEPAVRTKLSQ